MISIIVSSHREDYFAALKQNIADTIGVEYEIIKIDNPGIMGISEAYNHGIEKAKFKYLCFCHEDVLFHTKHWGKKLLEIFNYDRQIALVGIAGSPYLPYVYSGWSFPKSKFLRMCLVQSSNEKKGNFVERKANEGLKYEEVATVDGCFMATKKSRKRFDESLFKGYDCYDLDFSLQTGFKGKNIVTYEILLEHFSPGQFSTKWFKETLKFNKKWKKKLPIIKADLTINQIRAEEIGAYWFIYNLLIRSGNSLKPLLKYSFDLKFIKLIGFRNYSSLLYKTLKLYLRSAENNRL